MAEQPPVSDQISTIGERVLARLESTNVARERALAETRQIVRMSANAIRAVHRNNFDEARELLSKARAMQDALAADLVDAPNIYWSGYVQDAQKELAEANIVLGIISGSGVPAPEDLNVEDAVYLNGLAEAASELRRYILDALRRGEPEQTEALLQTMDDVYGLLVSVDYPDAVTGGLRRTTDMLRGVLERTRGDLTISMQQRDLLAALDRAANEPNTAR